MKSSIKGTVVVIHKVKFIRDIIVEALAGSSIHAEMSVFATCSEAEASLKSSCPNVILLEVTSAAAEMDVEKITNRCPGSAVVVWGMAISIEQVVRLAQLGVAGYITCEDSTAQLVVAVENAYQGEISNSKVAGILNSYVHREHQKKCPNSRSNSSKITKRALSGSSDRTSLTSRETEIIKLIDEGLSNKDIANSLCVELSTVKNHVHSILGKYQVDRRTKAAAQYRSQKNYDSWAHGSRSLVQN